MPQFLSHPAALAAFGLFIGFLGSLIGVGGGFLMVPYFHLVLGWSPLASVGTSLSVIAANATSGAAGFARQKRVDFLVGFVLGVASLPGAVLGEIAGRHLPGGPFKIAFALIGLVAAWLMIFGRMSERPGMAWFRRGPRRRFTDAFGESYDYSLNLAAAAALSVALGFIAGLFGVGGGFIHVPVLILLFGMPAHVAMATSHFVLVITTAVGAGQYAWRGHVSGMTFVWLALGAMIGAQAGVRLAARTAGMTLRRIFGAILIVVAAIMAWKGYRESA